MLRKLIDFYRLRKRKHQCSWNLHWNPQAAQTRAPVLLECTLNLYFLLRSRFFRIVQEGMTMSLEILYWTWSVPPFIILLIWSLTRPILDRSGLSFFHRVDVKETGESMVDSTNCLSECTSAAWICIEPRSALIAFFLWCIHSKCLKLHPFCVRIGSFRYAGVKVLD